MSAELIGAKMLAPYFGSSLYVWSTVMAVTLGGLASGYFLGGLISSRKNNPKTLYVVVLIAALFIMLMPVSSEMILSLSGKHALLPSVILCTTFFLLPPVLMMGMVAPLIIHALEPEQGQAGKAAGAVYAVSTIGGIFSTLITGFWLIPEFGLRLPCICLGMILSIIPLCWLVIKAKSRFYFLIGLILLLTVVMSKTWKSQKTEKIHILYQSEGLMGQLIVADYPEQLKTGSPMNGKDRVLFANRIWQTRKSTQPDSVHLFNYIAQILHHIPRAGQNRKVLLCGLGGGILAQELQTEGFQVEACELDARMVFVSHAFFGLNSSIPVHIDDARHFIRTTTSKYDFVILDLFKGEETPGHCFTMEAFSEIKSLLNPDGLLIINGPGFITGEAGAGMRAVFRTLLDSDFDLCLMPAGEGESGRNLLFYACKKGSQTVSKVLVEAKERGEEIISGNSVLGSADKCMVDDKPVLDQLNLIANKIWRRNAINFFEDELHEGRMLPLFR